MVGRVSSTDVGVPKTPSAGIPARLAPLISLEAVRELVDHFKRPIERILRLAHRVGVHRGLNVEEARFELTATGRELVGRSRSPARGRSRLDGGMETAAKADRCCATTETRSASSGVVASGASSRPQSEHSAPSGRESIDDATKVSGLLDKQEVAPSAASSQV